MDGKWSEIRIDKQMFQLMIVRQQYCIIVLLIWSTKMLKNDINIILVPLLILIFHWNYKKN